MITVACANPACSCELADDGCSPWCRALDRPAGERCRCGHDGCVPVPAREVRAPGPRWLVVVRRGQPELYPAVPRRFEEPLCQVVLDRRRADRRQRRTPVDADRRRVERRQALTPREAEQWLRSGYHLVCRAEVAWPRARRLG